jgi:hypothetical protein
MLAMGDHDGDSNQGPSFDPVAAAATMRTLAEFAQQCVEHGAVVAPELVGKALAELHAAEAWLDARLADFGISDRRPLVTDDENGDHLAVDALVYTLRYAAIELLQVHKLLELRAFRKKP